MLYSSCMGCWEEQHFTGSKRWKIAYSFSHWAKEVETHTVFSLLKHLSQSLILVYRSYCNCALPQVLLVRAHIMFLTLKGTSELLYNALIGFNWSKKHHKHLFLLLKLFVLPQKTQCPETHSRCYISKECEVIMIDRVSNSFQLKCNKRFNWCG